MKIATAIVLCIIGLAVFAGIILNNMDDDSWRNDK